MRRSLLITPFCLVLHLGGHPARVLAAEPIAPRFDDLDIRENAEATYRANAYQVIHVGEDSSWWRPARGNYRLSIDHDAFFASLGRPDLASQFASRHALGRTLELGGFGIAIAGVIVTPYSLYKGSGVGALVGAGMMVGGVIARGIGADLQKPAFAEDQAMDMTLRYNDALRTHLGLKAAVSISATF